MTDASTTRNPDRSFFDVSVIYIFASSVGILVSAWVPYTFIRYKKLRKHPASLMVSKVVADLLFEATVLIMSLIIDEDLNNARTPELNGYCSTFAFFLVLFFEASHCYFIGMCSDLASTLTYPLRDTTNVALRIHLITWFVSFSLATVVYTIAETDHAWQYQAEDEICFFRNDYFDPKVMVIALPYLLGILSGITTAVYVWFRARHGLPALFAHTRRIVKEHLLLLLGYVCVAILWLCIFIVDNLFAGNLLVIVIGTAVVNAGCWYFQKFRGQSIMPKKLTRMRNKLAAPQLSSMASFDISSLPESEVPSGLSTPGGDAGGNGITFGKGNNSTVPTFRSNNNLFVNDGTYNTYRLINEMDFVDSMSDASGFGHTSFHNRTIYNQEQSISDALKIELIKFMCHGIEESILTVQEQFDARRASAVITGLDFPAQDALNSPQEIQNKPKRGYTAINQQRGIVDTNQSIVTKMLSVLNSDQEVPFTDYAPHVFRYLRVNVYKIKESEYHKSIQMSIKNELQSKFSEGKSGYDNNNIN